jgi:iron complex transport system ATP-binding protein
VLLLDEPTTFLDLKHQIQTYRLLQRLAREGMAVVAVTHDLNLASSYADRIVVLSRGRVAADGTPDEVVRAELLREVFEVDVEIRPDHAGRPWVYYCQPSR